MRAPFHLYPRETARRFEKTVSTAERLSGPLECGMRAMLVYVSYPIRSTRQLVEQLRGDFTCPMMRQPRSRGAGCRVTTFTKEGREQLDNDRAGVWSIDVVT